MEKEKRKREGGRRGDLEGNKKSCTRRKGKEEDRRRVRLGKEKVEEGAQEGGLERGFFSAVYSPCPGFVNLLPQKQ